MTDVYEEERLRSYLTAEEEAYYVAAEQEYYDEWIKSMTPHDRKHSLNASRMDLKGLHRHNHITNMELRLMLTKKEIKALRKIMKRDKKK